MIAANPHQRCKDFDRDAEIWNPRVPRAADCVCKERKADLGLWHALARASVPSGPATLSRYSVWSEIRGSPE